MLVLRDASTALSSPAFFADLYKHSNNDNFEICSAVVDSFASNVKTRAIPFADLTFVTFSTLETSCMKRSFKDLMSLVDSFALYLIPSCLVLSAAGMSSWTNFCSRIAMR